MNRLNSTGKLFIHSLKIPIADITTKLVFDILSLQGSLSPYSQLESRKIKWKIQGKKLQGGHFNVPKFMEKFSPLEK